MEASAKHTEKKPRNTPHWLRDTNWNWYEALVVALVATIGCSLFLGLLLSGLAAAYEFIYPGYDDIFPPPGWWEVGDPWSQFLFYAASSLLGIGFVFFFLNRIGVSARALGFRKFKVFRTVGLLALGTIVFVYGNNLVFTALDQLAPGIDLAQEQENVFVDQLAGGSVLAIALSFISLVIIAPIAEEIIFRGVLFAGFAKSWGVWPAAIASSLLFGLVHMQLNVIIVTALLGLLLCWLYYKTRSLWPAILMHSLKNLLAFLLLIGMN